LEFCRYLLSFRRPYPLPVTVGHLDFLQSADIEVYFQDIQGILLYRRCSCALSFHWNSRRGDNNEKKTKHTEILTRFSIVIPVSRSHIWKKAYR